jgi:hypothetical protein
LDGRGDIVARELDVGEKVGIQGRSAEGCDRIRAVATRRRDRNVVVFLKVDSRVLLRRVVGSAEKLPLRARVGGTNDVLSIAPLTIARAASITAAAASSSSGRANIEIPAVSVGVEPASSSTLRTVCSPARLLSRGRAIKAWATRRTRSGTGGTARAAAPTSTTSIEVAVAEE